MVVGDIIAARSASAITFQPAAGVEIILTAISTQDPSWVYVQDSGGSTSMFYYAGTAYGKNANIKIGITNSFWLYLANYGAYTGIQIK